MYADYREANSLECSRITHINIKYVIRDAKDKNHPLGRMRLTGTFHRWYIKDLEEWMDAGKPLDFIPSRMRKHAKQEAGK